jgi:hypothetical protein
MRIAAATASYFLTLGGAATAVLCDIAGLSGPATVLVAGSCILGVHVGYGAVARTYWACAVCLAVPVIAVLLGSTTPYDPDVDWPVAFAYGAVVLTPCVAGLIALGAAAGGCFSRRSAHQ